MRSAHDEQRQPNLFIAGAAPGLSLFICDFATVAGPKANVSEIARSTGWTSYGLLKCSRASFSPDQINEYASVVVPQVGQFVGEVGEVVADASLQVLADVMIDGGQDAAAALI